MTSSVPYYLTDPQHWFLKDLIPWWLRYHSENYRIRKHKPDLRWENKLSVWYSLEASLSPPPRWDCLLLSAPPRLDCLPPLGPRTEPPRPRRGEGAAESADLTAARRRLLGSWAEGGATRRSTRLDVASPLSGLWLDGGVSYLNQ